MALALYRKYRPRTFAEVIGQEHVTEPLSQALRSGRLHHAYLFSGPRGCGKTSSARILARSLNCEQGPTPDPCGVCASCTSLANDGAGSIDVIEIDAASHGGVDDARELREKAFFAPATSRYKIYVIDEAHMVSSAGFNALLKLVEEPPDYVKFIFATTEPEKVLGTIRSRTHHYPFRLIPPAVLRPYLQQLTEAEGVHVEPAVFPLVVRAGGGSARDTLSVLDQLIAGAGPEGVSYARAVALLGVTDVALIDEMCDALAAGDGAAAYQTIDRVAEAGHDPRRFATDLLERFRDLIVLQQVPDAVSKGLIDGPADQLDAMGAQATRLGPATLSRCADIVHNGLVEMRGTTAPRLLLELITARMLLPGADDTTGALLQRLERMERRLTLSADPAPEGVRGPAAPEATAAVAAEGGGGGGGLSAARAAAAAAGRRSPAGIGSSPRAGSDGAGGAPSATARPASAAAPGQGGSGEAEPEDDAVGPGSETAGDPVERQPAAPRPAQPGMEAATTEPAPPVAATRHRPEESWAGDVSTGEMPAEDVAPQAEPAGRAPVASSGPADTARTTGSEPAVPPQERRPEPMPDAPEEFAEPAAVPGQLTAAAVREVWPEIIAAVGRQSKKVAALASGATVRDLDGQTVVLTFRFPAHAKMVADQPQLLVDALYEALGGRWQIRCEVAGEAGGVRAAGGAAPGRGAPAQGGPAPAGPAPAGPAQRPGGPAAQRPAPGGRAPGPQRQVPAPAQDSDDGDDWPEPVRPGGASAALAAVPSAGGAADAQRNVGESDAAPASPQSADSPAGLEGVPTAGAQGWGGGAPSGPQGSNGLGSGSASLGGGGSAGATATTATRDATPNAAPRAAAPPTPAPSSDLAAATAPTSNSTAPAPTPAPSSGLAAARAAAAAPVPAPSGGVAAARAAAAAPVPAPSGGVAAARAAAVAPASAPSGGVAAARAAAAAPASAPSSGAAPASSSDAAPAPAPSSGLAAARAAAAASSARAAQAARGRPSATPAKATASNAWSDGSPTEEAPYDPEYDGPPAPDSPVYEGFDPGDEPLDDVIDEKTARQTSEQQAMQLLRDAFGAEKISEL